MGIEPVDDWVLHHDEHRDGSGYPSGLAGEAIPLGARIVVVADAFEAMTRGRPYRAAAGVQEALDELHENAGSQFDPEVVQALERHLAAATAELRVRALAQSRGARTAAVARSRRRAAGRRSLATADAGAPGR
jgi:HD-GYP domain-containing protein (c-di-GMP phosphodiesterase class II)